MWYKWLIWQYDAIVDDMHAMLYDAGVVSISDWRRNLSY